MKKIFTLFFLNLAFLGLAQQTLSVNTIPAGYYNTATGTGYALKTQLFNIINGIKEEAFVI